ncbi:uncharacterized protein CLUP02_01993 [Colletotrichum lupini]|uniref:Uncharacterized protein n=1 Tax=Colletotrichum lupini TaxID=145971 RepID=A0A9Q8W9P2_9PEZI|nr:uncharacterized protein CLUP02_01993 [Colletotrichum lupini]UQC75339.1 hypothetical protein CLUP02_01993 [Colletotrichum lupini]
MPLSHLFTLPVTCLREANAAPHWQLQLGMVVSAQIISIITSRHIQRPQASRVLRALNFSLLFTSLPGILAVPIPRRCFPFRNRRGQEQTGQG